MTWGVAPGWDGDAPLALSEMPFHPASMVFAMRARLAANSDSKRGNLLLAALDLRHDPALLPQGRQGDFEERDELRAKGPSLSQPGPTAQVVVVQTKS